MSNRILIEAETEPSVTKEIKQEACTDDGNCNQGNNLGNVAQDNGNSETQDLGLFPHEVSITSDSMGNIDQVIGIEGNVNKDTEVSKGNVEIADNGLVTATKNEADNADANFKDDSNNYQKTLIDITMQGECKTGEDVFGKSGQDNVKPKSKKRPSELELLGAYVKENLEDVDSKYDVFGDDSNVYRKYKLRRSGQQVSYKEPTGIQPKHRDSSDDDIKPLICKICFTQFDSKRSLQGHIRSHEFAKGYQCSLCFEKFKNNVDLVAHKSSHTESFLCKQCKLAFSDHCDFLLHNLIHTTVTVFKCPECGLRYNKKSYKMHILTHFNKTVTCPICPFTTNGEHNLQTHIYWHNSNLTCVECGKVCKGKGYYNYHISTHTGVKKYQCLYCGKGFRTNSMRAVHTRIHTNEKPFTCDICGHKSRQWIDKRRHKATHGPRKQYTCDYCSKNFIDKSYLISHIRMHTKSSLYQCPECNKSFLSSGGLKVHTMFKHLSERPVECNVCDKKFINKNQFEKHCRSKYHKRNMYGHLNKEGKNSEMTT